MRLPWASKSKEEGLAEKGKKKKIRGGTRSGEESQGLRLAWVLNSVAKFPQTREEKNET